MFDVSRRNIHKARPVGAYVQPRQVAYDLPPLMLNGETILQHRNFTRKAGKRRHDEGDDPSDGLY
jgi:hypothetical protein